MTERTTPTLSKTPNKYGKYEIRWSELHGDTWRSKSKTTGTGDKTLAEQALAAFLVGGDVLVEPTVSECIDFYVNKKSVPNGSDARDISTLKASDAALGDVKALSLSDIHIAGYTHQRLATVSASTVRRELVALQAVMNFNSKKGRIPNSPTYDFDKPEESAPRDMWITELEEKQILGTMKRQSTHLQAFIQLALTYGVRKGAIMDLSFGPQIDFQNRKIDFNRPGARITRKRRPVVPMTDAVKATLAQIYLSCGEGQKVIPRNIMTEYKAFMAGLGLEHVTPHILKHSAVTLMLRGGASMEAVSKLTATDMRTLRKVYRHHSDDELLETALRRR